jgi:hypothetical protein
MTARTFSAWVDKGFWYLLVASVSYGAKSVAELNVKMAVVIDQVQSHEARIHSIENWRLGALKGD